MELRIDQLFLFYAIVLSLFLWKKQVIEFKFMTIGLTGILFDDIFEIHEFLRVSFFSSIINEHFRDILPLMYFLAAAAFILNYRHKFLTNKLDYILILVGGTLSILVLWFDIFADLSIHHIQKESMYQSLLYLSVNIYVFTKLRYEQEI